jgi:hypoxanthine phosphoribosyltransferase
MGNLIGKNILIVDEVDDTRTTLEYAVRELEKDVQEQANKDGRGDEKTTFSIFVLHNKDKAKKGKLPDEMINSGRYLAAQTVGDVWINYPWEATYVSVSLCILIHANSGLAISTSTTRTLRFRRTCIRRGMIHDNA